MSQPLGSIGEQKLWYLPASWGIARKIEIKRQD